MPTISVSERAKAAKAQRDKLVVDHLPLVRSIAMRVREMLPVHVDVDDLIHAGVLGLIDAVEKYNVNKQVNFQIYAKHRIRGAILDSLRQMDWASRDMRRRQREMNAAARDLSNELGRTPSDLEVAARLGLDEPRWHRMTLQMRMTGLTSLSSELGDDEQKHREPAGKPEWRPDQIAARRELRRALSAAMNSLPDRYRKVVLMYYSGDLSMKEIGAAMGINESRVSQIHKSALEKMARALNAAGIQSINEF
jgi:RNA polymerase sigma factor FliA